MNPFDLLQGIEPVLRRTGDTPMRFAGRLVGLGAEQQQAGVPKWAWLGVGLIAGASLAWVYGEDVRRFARTLRR